ncbi:MAG: Acetylspermidine deacetylase [Candidatus Jettenia ecosi]|uniref:Acetylspermidine deacetylase n=1 Tax=Candidatus Jettenia ecosi TaxID=2494326 RepID=A0A533QQB3_9BACT|nr:MAG: Acetylspermidine deacetylase [Candidatus Jettenia ecosi]
MTILMYDNIFLKHDTGHGHPENAKRLENTLKHLKATGLWDQLRVEKPRAASLEEIGLIHTENYIQTIKHIANTGGGQLDSDTIISAASYDAAVHAVGAPLAAIDFIMKGEEKNAFCLIRPPGHHAAPARGMGFCLFNNVAVAAKYIQSRYKLERIFIIDWDVHHGNGTQDAFFNDPTILYFSMHRDPFYPGSGRKEESGRDNGEGFTINVPVPANIPSQRYIELFTDVIKQNADQFIPEFIIISAGFDTYKKDPIGGLNLDREDFRILTEIAIRTAQKYCNGRLVSCLEGGYNLSDLPLCIEAHLKALLQG